MILKFKKTHPDAFVPQYATGGAACFDLHAVDIGGLTIEETRIGTKADLVVGTKYLGKRGEVFRTGLAFEVPVGHVMLIFSRSGQGFKHDVRLANCVGVIDSDYRGEVMVKLTKDCDAFDFQVKNGDRIAQAMLVPIPVVLFEESDELTETDRGEKGFGSTGA